MGCSDVVRPAGALSCLLCSLGHFTNESGDAPSTVIVVQTAVDWSLALTYGCGGRLRPRLYKIAKQLQTAFSALIWHHGVLAVAIDL